MKNSRVHRTYCMDSIRFASCLSATLLILSYLFTRFYASPANIVPAFSEKTEPPTVILDAGHGGVDSGAVSLTGEEEKYLNLAVVKKLGAFLENKGVRVLYTRTEDVMLESTGTGSRKTKDLMGRVEFAKKEPNAIFISIHMNTLPVEKYKGLQVFYTDLNDANRPLAQVVQRTVRDSLQQDNARSAKNSEGKIYILDRISQPAILIECGFISNWEEAALLNDEIYQTKLAYVLSQPILDFLQSR